jgi:hypothetical protein
MQQGNIAETAHVMADYLDEDNHELFCMAAMFPKHDDEHEFALSCGNNVSTRLAIQQVMRLFPVCSVCG